MLPRSHSCTGEERKGEKMGGKGKREKGSRGGREGVEKDRGEEKGGVNVTRTDVAIGFLQ